MSEPSALEMELADLRQLPARSISLVTCLGGDSRINRILDRCSAEEIRAALNFCRKYPQRNKKKIPLLEDKLK